MTHDPNTSVGVHPGDDLQSDEFFDVTYPAKGAPDDWDEIGAGFDFSAFEKPQGLMSLARRVLSLRLV